MEDIKVTHTTDWKLGYAEQALKGIIAILDQNSFKNKGVTTADAEHAKTIAYRALENIK
jgi:hypothetical protein